MAVVLVLPTLVQNMAALLSSAGIPAATQPTTAAVAAAALVVMVDRIQPVQRVLV
jgi:hypothetical protein